MGRKQFITLGYRFIEEESGKVASLCDDLGIASYGQDIASARAALDEAVSLVLNGMAKSEQIWAYLRERGVSVFDEGAADPTPRTYTNFTMRPGEWFNTITREVEAAASGA